LAKHPYLRPIGKLQAIVDEAASEACTAVACLPHWDDYADDFQAGVPLLLSSSVSIDLCAPARDLTALLSNLVSKSLPPNVGEPIRRLNAELHGDPDEALAALGCLLGRNVCSVKEPGMLQYLGWMVIVRYLRQVVAAFSRWRDEERWLRGYCPTCGYLPVMAQLTGADPARIRFLVCGRCATRWRYPRIACPFCQRTDDHRLAVLAAEGENGLRIDYCEACGAYLKTYDGEGSESVMLADWTSLHLDAAAADRALTRAASSLFALKPAGTDGL